MTRLIDIHGRPLQRKKRLANLVIYRSETGEDPWKPLMREEVPEDVKKPDVLGRLINGEMCRLDGDRHWYRAEKVATPADGLH